MSANFGASRNTRPGEPESVPLATARSDLAVCEMRNDEINKRRYAADALVEILMARDGVKLAAVYEEVVTPLAYARLLHHTELTEKLRVPTPERSIADSQLAQIEKVIESLRETSPNDDWARTAKQALVLFMLVREPEFRALFIAAQPPPHPLPQSAEAQTGAQQQVASRPVAHPEAVVAFLQEHLLPSYTALIKGTTQRIDLRNWVVSAACAYITRLPPHNGFE